MGVLIRKGSILCAFLINMTENEYTGGSAYCAFITRHVWSKWHNYLTIIKNMKKYFNDQ